MGKGKNVEYSFTAPTNHGYTNKAAKTLLSFCDIEKAKDGFIFSNRAFGDRRICCKDFKDLMNVIKTEFVDREYL